MRKTALLIFILLFLGQGCTEKHPSYKGAEDEFLEIQNEILSVKIGLDSTTLANLTLEEINKNLDEGKFQFRRININDIRYIHRLIGFSKAVPVASSEKAVIETQFGTIVINFYSTLAPGHCANFKLLANSGYFDGLLIYKIIPGEIIYSGSITTMDFYTNNEDEGSPGYSIKSELNNALFKRGVIGMVKSENAFHGSHGSQFFILLNDSPEFNNRFTPFGEVIEGLDVLDQIGKLAVKNNVPIEKVIINRIRVIDR